MENKTLRNVWRHWRQICLLRAEWFTRALQLIRPLRSVGLLVSSLGSHYDALVLQTQIPSSLIFFASERQLLYLRDRRPGICPQQTYQHRDIAGQYFALLGCCFSVLIDFIWKRWGQCLIRRVTWQVDCDRHAGACGRSEQSAGRPVYSSDLQLGANGDLFAQ